MVTPGMSVGDGRILGMEAQREGSEAHIQIQLGQLGEPDLGAWEAGRAQVEALLKDPEVKTYIISGRSNAASQVLFSARRRAGVRLPHVLGAQQTRPAQRGGAVEP